MYAHDLFHTVPLWVIYFFTVAVVLAALWAGLWLGRRYIRAVGSEHEPSIGSAVTATLGLLAFLLAFTFNMTADRYNQRKALLLNEVNAIHSTYLQADFLLPAARDEAKRLLARYVDLRDFDPAVDMITVDELKQSVEIQDALWALVDLHVAQHYNAGYLRQYVESLTEVINDHTSRLVIGLEYRIPTPIWVALYFLTALSMLAIGFQFGVSRGGSNQVAVTLAVTFATVILLIADLDRATEGVLTVDQNPMSELNTLLKREQAQR